MTVFEPLRILIQRIDFLKRKKKKEQQRKMYNFTFLYLLVFIFLPKTYQPGAPNDLAMKIFISKLFNNF